MGIGKSIKAKPLWLGLEKNAIFPNKGRLENLGIHLNSN
tara:strand:- start:843 stop:959 length:117 start_codon:yes stop_codon:yes gene_type:complete